MKKLTALLLVSVMVLGLCACTQPKETTKEEQNTSIPTPSAPTVTETPSATSQPAAADCTLTFAAQDGTVFTTLTVKAGSTASIPDYPFPTESQILGFFTKQDGKGSKFEETEITKDTTFYMYTLHDKQMNNQNTSTEEDIDVIPVGLYEFVAADGKKLSYSGETLSFVDAEGATNTKFLVSFQNSGKDSTGRGGVKYVIYTGDSVAKSLFFLGNSVSVKESNDRLYNYLWYIIENEDGTVTVKNINQNKYISNDNGSCTMTVTSSDAKLQMNLVSDEYDAFKQIISEEGKIIMRYSSKLEKQTRLREARMTKLTNDMQLAMNSFHGMTDFLPYESIVIRIYQNEPYYGYVYGGWNVISFNLGNATSDLGLMPQRDKLGINDWNFCLLHEMGHMFDWNRGWRFYGEFSNNFKLAQVLYDYSDLGASAATAGWAAKDCFNASEIKNMWNSELKGKSMSDIKKFDLSRMLYIFVVYAERIGWENVSKAYKELQAMDTQVSGEKNRFWAFTDTMAKYAPEGLHVKDLLDEGEIDYILNELK